MRKTGYKLYIPEYNKTMIIGIDGNEANVERKVGISEFAYELLTQFIQQQTDNTKYQVYLKSAANKDMPAKSANLIYRIFGPQIAWTQWRLPLDLFMHRPRPDIFFTPTHYAPRFSVVPTVISVMDLSYVHYPSLFKKADLYQLTKWTEYSVKKAKAVITISNSSRDDIMRVYGKPGQSIYVVYPGIKPVYDLQPHIYPMNELKNKYGIADRYILFVGTLQPRKNISKLIEAYSILLHKAVKQDKNRIKDTQLVIAGKKGWLYEDILAAPRKYGVEDNVNFLDYVTDEHLPLLYKHALCFVLPSLYEGFGLPILEAMNNDCPVIAGNISSMPEAGGDAALYVDPGNATDIAQKIEKLISDEKLRRDLIEKGRKQVKKFSWQKAAKETLEIIKNTAKNNKTGILKQND